MFRRGLLLLFSILVTLAFFASSYANTPAGTPVVAPAQPLTVFPAIVTVIKSANVRGGPGTDFPIISAARPGQRLTVYGCNFDCSWYLLADDCWIAAFLVQPEQPSTVSIVAPVVVPVVTAAIPLPTGDPRLPTVVVSIPLTLTEGVIQTTQCPQTIAAVNTYAGPGLTFTVVEALPAGECVAVVARNTLGDWVQLSHGMWMLSAAILHPEPVALLPVLDQIFTPTPIMPPTPTSAPGLSAEEQDYLNFVNSQLQAYSSARDTLTDQYALLAEDPTLLTNEDWRALTSSTTLLIRVVNENLRARLPPSRFVIAHAELINAANHFELASNLIDDALETFDVALLATAEASAIAGDAALQRANVLIEESKLQLVVVQVVVPQVVVPQVVVAATGKPVYPSSSLPTATLVPTATVSIPIFTSNGLGLTREAWEAKMGTGIPDVVPTFQKYGDLIVAFDDNKVAYIERQWTNPVSPDDALALGMSYAPTDGYQAEVYSPSGRPETTVHLFISPSLAAEFPADSFVNGQPGNYTVQYNSYDGQVTRMIVRARQ